MSLYYHRFYGPSLTTRLYRPSPLAGPPDYMLYRHRAVVDRY